MREKDRTDAVVARRRGIARPRRHQRQRVETATLLPLILGSSFVASVSVMSCSPRPICPCSSFLDPRSRTKSCALADEALLPHRGRLAILRARWAGFCKPTTVCGRFCQATIARDSAVP